MPQFDLEAQAEDEIFAEFYCTLDQADYFNDDRNGFWCESNNEVHLASTIKKLEYVTVCSLVARNGYVAVGTYAPPDPDMFDAELGRRAAKQAALRKLMDCLAFEYQTDLLEGNYK